MAEYKHKKNTAVLFPNKYKSEGDKAPNYKGSGVIEIRGDVEIGLWVNCEEGTKKIKNLKLGFSEPYKKGENPSGPREFKQVVDVQLSDEMPF